MESTHYGVFNWYLIKSIVRNHCTFGHKMILKYPNKVRTIGYDWR